MTRTERRRARQRAYRRRRAAGEPTLRDTLVATGRLKEWDSNDPSAVGRAAAKLFADWQWVTESTGIDPCRKEE
jgi:hypothetical protein